MNRLAMYKPPSFLCRILLCLLVIAILGIIIRLVHFKNLRADTEKQGLVSVVITTVKSSPLQEEIILPGNVQSWHEAIVYARTNGYIRQWYTDIGAIVKKDQLLAEIYSPEVDAQLKQTEADLKTAEANYQLARITALRWSNLVKTLSVSQQEADEKRSNEKSLDAVVASTRANRDRLRDLVSFEKVLAPFDGIITDRQIDIGTLINAGSNNGSMALFKIVQSNPLRIYVQVPQNYAKQITSDLLASLYFPQDPGQSYPATLLDTAKAIDPISRTLLIQLEAKNPLNRLFSGSYVEVHLFLPAKKHSVEIPVNTLVFQKEGLQVASLSKDNRVILKSIHPGRDFGHSMEVLSGLNVGERIILNPQDSLIAGQKVHVAAISSPILKES